jgi:hypothetical protein
MRLLFGLVCCAGIAAAQWSNFNGLAQGSEVRVQTFAGKWTRGFFQKATDHSIVLNAATSQETIEKAEVKRVQLKKSGHRGRNTLIGLGVGTAGGLATGAGLDAKMNDDWFPNAGKAVLAPIGAVIGTVIGVAWPTGGWFDLYRVK